MHPGLLDVLHHTADEHLAGVVADRVDIDFGGVFEEPIDEHRTLGRQPTLLAEAAEPSEFGHRPGEMVAVVDDLHRPPTEHIARANEHREADLVDDLQRLLEIGRRAAGRLRDAQFVAQRVPLLPVFGEVDRVRETYRRSCRRGVSGELQRGLAAQRHDDLRRELPRC